jgi:hypothetical protein
MLLTAASTHSLFSKSKLAARTKGRRKQRGRPSGNQENKGTNPEKNQGGVPAPFFWRNIRWTARAWEGFQHQILKGPPCVAKALPRVLINPIQVSMA